MELKKKYLVESWVSISCEHPVDSNDVSKYCTCTVHVIIICMCIYAYMLLMSMLFLLGDFHTLMEGPNSTFPVMK